MSLSRMWTNYMQTARPFWFFVYYAFNRLDVDRRTDFGPDRTCAEWILRNGGQISTCDRPQLLLANYNLLPPASRNPQHRFRLNTIVAQDCGLIAAGFEHLEGCTCVQRIVLDGCAHLENEALEKLHWVRKSLKQLELRRCRHIRDSGLLGLAELQGLQELRLGYLPGVGHMEQVVRQLRLDAPQCKVLVEEGEQC